ncbi:MAG TPA: RDD family protein [Longimicrobiales bacterium]|nr:RDD family protein [Longimicrobiales bacterium]
MQTQAPPRDPRSIITPDAFEVSAELLGMPLASPSRRFFALMIDLAVIGTITLLTRSFALVLGVVAAVFFVRAGFRRTPVRGSVFGRAMRLSVGCLGLVIGVGTAIVWTAVGFGGGAGPQDGGPGSGIVTEISGLGEVLGGFRDVERFRGATTGEEALEAARAVVGRGRQLGLGDAELREILVEAAPTDAPWSDELVRVLDRALAGEVAEAPAVDSGIAEMTTAEAIGAYAALLGADTPDEGAAARRAELRARLASELAADTLRLLEGEVADLEGALRAERDRSEGLRRSLARAREGTSLFSWLRGFVDELGFGFGWASLYLTVMLSWWQGRTVGKRILGIRVLRLDGEPITWWTAFERAGGYAAGFATGLLGFAQIYWDANRQAIHDRIVGTVVVLDGAERVGNWQEAM